MTCDGSISRAKEGERGEDEREEGLTGRGDILYSVGLLL